MQGRVLDTEETARAEVFLESLTVAEGNPFIEALRTQDWKYVRYLQPQGCPYVEDHLDFSQQEPLFEQLFYLPADPDEKQNLIGDEQHSAVADDLRERTRRRSIELTKQGLENKAAMSVGRRPADGVYCW